MRLYSRWQNSAGERVRIALNLKNVPYDYVPVGSLPQGAYRRLNPQGLLPALDVHGRIIAQSTAILEYLEEIFPQPALLPEDPIERAQARAFAQLITSDLHPLNNHRVRVYLSRQLGASDEAVSGWYRHWVAAAFAALEEALAARPRQSSFCYGEAPGWADLHLVPQLANARRFDCDLSAYPRLRAVERACAGLDAFLRARPEAQPDYPSATAQ